MSQPAKILDEKGRIAYALAQAQENRRNGQVIGIVGVEKTKNIP